MKIQALDFENSRMQSITKWIRLTFLCVAILMLGACDSGSSGDGGIDPGILEIPVAFIKRPVPVDDMGDDENIDLREPRLFMAGGDVYLRTSSASDATVTNITSSVTNGIGDVKGLNSNHDGTKLIFSLRLFDPDPNNPPFPTWNVYEYDLETSQLRRIISSATIAESSPDRCCRVTTRRGSNPIWDATITKSRYYPSRGKEISCNGWHPVATVTRQCVYLSPACLIRSLMLPRTVI